MDQDLDHWKQSHDHNEDGVDGFTSQRADGGNERDEVVRLGRDVLGHLEFDQTVSEIHLKLVVDFCTFTK